METDMRFDDIDPQDIDPDTNRPYAGYSSPSLDTSFHDHEMNVDEPRPARGAAELVKQWEAEGGEKTSLYWRLKQLAVEGK
jgi:hypothetical protein